MKKLVLLFAALLVAGCGEKSSSGGSESASENPTASNDSAETAADTAKPPPRILSPVLTIRKSPWSLVALFIEGSSCCHEVDLACHS